MQYDAFCLSSYLAFRYVVRQDGAWLPGVAPVFPALSTKDQRPVRSADEVLEALRGIFARLGDLSRTGILLSGGIDSAILSRFLPAGTKAYTIRFVADGAVDETPMARLYAEAGGLAHRVVEVTWGDHLAHMDALMARKRSPLHAIEVALYKAAAAARADGVETLIVGNGADSTFGGMDKLLSRDWTLPDFVRRYTFVEPQAVLRRPVSMLEVYAAYEKAGRFDVVRFLKTVHGLGIVQSFETAIHAAGCRVVAPYEELFLDAPLDLARIRTGESKYILRELFARLFPVLEAPDKIPFARPMDRWLACWEGPCRPEFREGLDLTPFTGDQKWLLYCLERFLNLFEVRA